MKEISEKTECIEKSKNEIKEIKQESSEKEAYFNSILKDFSDNKKINPSMEINLKEDIKHLKVNFIFILLNN